MKISLKLHEQIENIIIPFEVSTSKFSDTSITTLFVSFFVFEKLLIRHQITRREKHIIRTHAKAITTIDSKDIEKELSWRWTRVWLRPYFCGIWNSQSSGETTSCARFVISLSVILLSYALQTSAPYSRTSVWAVIENNKFINAFDLEKILLQSTTLFSQG